MSIENPTSLSDKVSIHQLSMLHVGQEEGLIRPAGKLPEGTILASDVEGVLAFLEANKREDGGVLIHDEIGVATQFIRSERGTYTGDPKTRAHTLMALGWEKVKGRNAMGEYERVAIEMHGNYRVVAVKDGKAFVGSAWITKVA